MLYTPIWYKPQGSQPQRRTVLFAYTYILPLFGTVNLFQALVLSEVP